jgi:nicotinamide-nucleotide amidase
MTAELLFVGTELLLGQTLNTNAQYLSGRLAASGVNVFHQTVVGDNQPRVEACIRTALGRADVLIVSGGLGPTSDDLTKEAAAAVLGRRLLPDGASRAAIEGYFAAVGRRMTENNLKQALIPEGGEAIPNPNGTAPGIKIQDGSKLVFLLPGPPSEFEPMVEAAVIPALGAMQPGGQTIVSRVLRFCGIGESELETRLNDLISAQSGTTVAPLASLGEVAIRLTAKAESEAAARARIAPVEELIRARLGRYLYGTDQESLPGVVVRLLAERRLTLALAESCTGGLLADQLTDIPGASAVLLAGVVAYTGQAKAGLLAIPRESVSEYGPVSEQVCSAMARNVRRISGADLGIGITCVAGPGGGSAKTPVGLAFIGLAHGPGDGVRVARRVFRGSRRVVKCRAAKQALVMLRDRLLGQEDSSGH